MSITLTENAIKHVRGVLAKHPNGLGLRVGVKTTGCSGYQYVIDTATEINDHDQTIEFHDVKVVIDKLSLDYLNNCELDFVKEGLNSGFKFNNPNVQETCGCGESFSLKEEVNA